MQKQEIKKKKYIKKETEKGPKKRRKQKHFSIICLIVTGKPS